MYHQKWSLAEIENLYCWERDVFIFLLKKEIKKESDKLKEIQNKK